MEFTMGIHVAMSHLLKLAIAVVVGACVVLPALSPVFMSAIAALSAKAGALAGIAGTVLTGLSRVAA